MNSFSIHKGATVLCTWELPSGTLVFPAAVSEQNACLTLGEMDRCAFVLEPPQPEREYRLFVGDVASTSLMGYPVDPGGILLPTQRVWPEATYFESARGETIIALEYRDSEENWKPELLARIGVCPTKVTELGYQVMAADLQALGRSLVVDLYGKSTSTYEARFARQVGTIRSAVEELGAIADTVGKLVEIVDAVSRRPASRIVRERSRVNYWGTQAPSRKALADMSKRGISPAKAARPVPLLDYRPLESFDIPEHRSLKYFLLLLRKRTLLCTASAEKHIRAITSEKPLRDMAFSDGPSIYQTIDRPKIVRLRSAARMGRKLSQVIQSVQSLPFLKDVPAQLTMPNGGIFERTNEYKALYQLMRKFVGSVGFWHEGREFTAVSKLTSRVFEQWCFLRIVEAFRKEGLELREWSEVLRDLRGSKFITDFDRGMHFEGTLGPRLRIRFRYEPWILGLGAARLNGETLCRVSSESVAWCPDVVIECLKEQNSEFQPLYVIVLDCKYTKHIREEHWHDTTKYLQIRATQSRKQVVRQLWLISVGNESIVSRDPGVSFNERGPTCPVDEAALLRMEVQPSMPVEQSCFGRFASGTISYLRRELA